MFVLDTNILILYLRKDPLVSEWLEKHILHGERFTISILSVTELFSYPALQDSERLSIDQFLRDMLILELDMSIARLAARYRREHKLKTVDALIAATAYILHATLVTRDFAFKKLGKSAVIIL